MADRTSIAAPDLLRRIRLPVAIAIAVVVGAAWYVTWAAADVTMALMAMPMTPAGPAELALFLLVLVVMMVAMMLPAALPMVLAFHGLTRLEGGRATKPADLAATALFVVPYFLIWGAFSVLALLGLMALGVMGPLGGGLVFVPSAILVAAGAYQVTRAKEVCLAHCQSPASFVIHHWRSGRIGAARMGSRHAAYCIGCCWLFMIALFVAGAMSLLWMGILSVVIFAEKTTSRRVLVSRAIGIVLLVLGVLVGLQASGLL